jgi:hypothetical protein
MKSTIISLKILSTSNFHNNNKNYFLKKLVFFDNFENKRYIVKNKLNKAKHVRYIPLYFHIY